MPFKRNVPVLGPETAVEVSQGGRGLDCRGGRGLETGGSRGRGDSDNGLSGKSGGEADGGSDHDEKVLARDEVVQEDRVSR